jgi:ABC-2 type transport system ATP-binding protein
VIINKGRVVAIDTPDNLTARLKGAETVFVQIDGGTADVASTLRLLPGITKVEETGERRDGVAGFEVESERGRDVRREVARAVVEHGWGLLELRSARMSLEEVFLQLTTQEPGEEVARA